MATIRRKLAHSRSVTIPRATCHLLAGQPLADGEEAPVTDWSLPWRGRRPLQAAPDVPLRRHSGRAARLRRRSGLATRRPAAAGQPSAAAGVAVRAARAERAPHTGPT